MPDGKQQPAPWEKYGDQSGPWAKYGSSPSATPPASEFSGEENLTRAPFDVLAGAGKGALNTVENAGKLLTNWAMTPAQKAEADAEQEKLTTPSNAMQKLGFGGEQAAEYLLPMGAEEKLASAAGRIPTIGRFAEPAGRIAAGALSTGGIEKLHGGSFTTGAELGAGFGAAGELGRAVAPSIAESALGITRRQRGFGKTPGQAVLDDVQGIRPETIARNAGQRIGQLTGELESATASSPRLARTIPAIQIIDDEMAKAARQNNRGFYDQLQDIRNQLTTDFRTGQRIPSITSPQQILDLKRGIQSLEKSWNPGQQGMARGAVRKASRALDTELDATVPEAKGINQRISSLIEAKKGAANESRGAGVTQRAVHRMAAHTGALAGSVAGGYGGYREGGIPGAVAGATAGMVIPEIIVSPTTQMLFARGLRSGAIPRLGRSVAAGLLERDEGR